MSATILSLTLFLQNTLLKIYFNEKLQLVPQQKMTIFNADQSCIAIIWTIRSHIYIFMLYEDNTVVLLCKGAVLSLLSVVAIT